MPQWLTLTAALAQAAADGTPACRSTLIRLINRRPRIGTKAPARGSNRFCWLIDGAAMRDILRERARPRSRDVPLRPPYRRSTAAAPDVPGAP